MSYFDDFGTKKLVFRGWRAFLIEENPKPHFERHLLKHNIDYDEVFIKVIEKYWYKEVTCAVYKKISKEVK